jgi:GTP-binding protein
VASEAGPRLNLHAEFVLSSPKVEDCPAWDLPEYAFIGRSNVGKSSLINRLVGHKDLAKTSGRPGKTQLINLFKIERGTWVLADLPGYGYAKVSKTQRASFSTMIGRYVRERKNLALVFVLIDGRLEPQQVDLEFLKQLGSWRVPFALVFTKADKVSGSVLMKNRAAFEKAFLKDWSEMPQWFQTSAETGYGRDKLLAYIESVNAELSGSGPAI